MLQGITFLMGIMKSIKIRMDLVKELRTELNKPIAIILRH